jgi:hypothetical protein
MNVLDDHSLRSELDEMFRRRETDVGPTFGLPSAAKVRVRTRRVATTFASVITIVGSSRSRSRSSEASSVDREEPSLEAASTAEP